MLFEPIRAEAERAGKIIFTIPLHEEIIWNDERLNTLRTVEDILMIGYPSGLWDEVNNLPLIRKGITATHPATDFNGKSEEVIDMACFPGSSGSPVLIINEDMYTTKTGDVVVGTPRIILIGILYAGPRFDARGEIIVENVPTSTSATITTNIMMHLGYIIKAKEILQLGKYIKEIVK